MDLLSRAIARLAGGTLLAASLGLALLGVWILDRQLTLRGTVEPSVLVFTAVLTIVGLVCGVMGIRLTFNRPNRYRSLLPPLGWYAMTSVFALLGSILGFVVIRRGDYEQLVGVACTVAFAAWCWRAGRIAAARGRSDAGAS
jgi:hypothetical protein